MNAPTTHLTAGQRIAAMQAACTELTRRMPAGWLDWDIATTRAFKAAIAAINVAGTVPKAREAVTQLAAYYGRTVDQFDPGEGA